MSEPRFFMDHGVIHDRATGKHVVTDGEWPFDDTVEMVCELLNNLSDPVQGDGWPDWFPASPADIERGDELFIGGYTWTLRGEDGAKEYKYCDGRWYRLNAAQPQTARLRP